MSYHGAYTPSMRIIRCFIEMANKYLQHFNVTYSEVSYTHSSAAYKSSC